MLVSSAGDLVVGLRMAGLITGRAVGTGCEVRAHFRRFSVLKCNNA